ncbi:hypothetical protein KP509_21G056300 [Ceratopteris richardii]|uniref:Phospholipid/glycerol acyltransferase domain-containing protein n=1 Tax=Ceratopteris richardii TaxID=49495 RepID=A0A8T2SBN1_CERRI|nr:hypothetical protein KP509_21G056300 [Ceratopteris richardii]
MYVKQGLENYERQACGKRLYTCSFTMERRRMQQKPPQTGWSRRSSFPSVNECSSEKRKEQAVVSEMDGTLLRSDCAFSYYLLVALEAPAGLLRFLVLLVLAPVLYLLRCFLSERLAMGLLAWITFVGSREEDIMSVARAVLPKFYAEDVHPQTWRVMSSFSQRYLLTAYPRLMVEPFAKQYLGVQKVLGSELQFVGRQRRATGFFVSPGVLIGAAKVAALRSHFRHPMAFPDVALGSRRSDNFFLATCKEGYVVPPFDRNSSTRSPTVELCQPIIFHDGRLVKRPTPIHALTILLWAPFGAVISFLRIMSSLVFPMSFSLLFLRATGVRVAVRGYPPTGLGDGGGMGGVLFASTHRTLMDPVFISLALGRPIPAVTFSLARINELVSPIPTIRLCRKREKDAAIIKSLLQRGDLVICPEGTTCREPMLLRFSALFAELSNRVVPVATKCEVSMFYGTTARGWKGLDTFYFFMNPTPSYEVIFLKQLPYSLTCAGGRSPHEVANYVQNRLASTLGFIATDLTRDYKYRVLLGHP